MIEKWDTMQLPGSAAPEQERSVEITLDEAVSLLLKSIAMEEISLSKLMDVERRKVKEALVRCRCGDGSWKDTLKLNKSADDTLKTIAQLQMLLQFKLKNVQELLPCTSMPSCFCRCGSCVESGCSVMGEGKGCVCNRDDAFFHSPASVYVFLPWGDRKNNTIRYVVGDSCQGLHLYACAHNVTMRCSPDSLRQVVVCGAGRLKRRGVQEEQETGTASFTLTIERGETGAMAFRMELSARGTLCLEHDSGWVKVEEQASTLRIKSGAAQKINRYM